MVLPFRIRKRFHWLVGRHVEVTCVTVPTRPSAKHADPCPATRLLGEPLPSMNVASVHAPQYAARVTLVALFLLRPRTPFGMNLDRPIGPSQSTSCPSGSDICTAVYRVQRSHTPLVAAGQLMCARTNHVSGVRLTHVLSATKSPKPPAKPIGIAVSGVLSVGQYLLEPIEKNAATLCGLDSRPSSVVV
ncbi:hypothetical protein LMG26411_06923 [Cupriavidus numazuensis]|uniref:Uncharacterized protein n=1 Tax=Cupriavidus numazuensis TaxID=221992 RepID=A0ABN7QCC7_9BURK|nr:hypothetical protein LMG26411_06923 [Cupriavidus numazuensis]